MIPVIPINYQINITHKRSYKDNVTVNEKQRKQIKDNRRSEMKIYHQRGLRAKSMFFPPGR